MTTSLAGRYSSKVAVVTGAASGIGAATCHRLAAEGARLVLVDIARGVHEVHAELTHRGTEATAIECDVACADDWTKARDSALDRFGTVDVLVSNAFFNLHAPAHALSPETWDRILGVNLTATFLGVRAFHPELVENSGAVVVTSSVHALVGLEGAPAYAAAKGGLTALVRQLASEYGRQFRVNAVLPGPILTPAWAAVDEADRRRSIEQTVMHRFGTPEEVAATIAFLGSADASFITGASVVVDGGWSIYKTSV